MGGKSRPVRLRPAVQRFAEAMELKLRKHDEDRGEDGWDGEDIDWLHGRIHDELGEASEEIWWSTRYAKAKEHEKTRDCEERARGEYVDAANFCMMAFDVLGGGRP